MPIKMLKPSVDPTSLTPAQKEAVLHAYVFGTGRPPLFTPLELEKLAKALDPSGRMNELHQAQKALRDGRKQEAAQMASRIKVKTPESRQKLKAKTDSLEIFAKNK